MCQKHNDLGIDICRSHHADTDARSSLRKGRGSKQQNLKGATAMDWDSFFIAVKESSKDGLSTNATGITD